MKFLSLFFIMSLAFPCSANDAKQGESFFKDKKYEEAAESFLLAEIDDPDELKHSYNRGVSSLLGENFEEAVEAFEKSARSENKILKKEALFNLGHAYYGKGDLEASLKAFDDYLKIEPESQEAKENKAWVEKRIEEKKQQQQENQDNSDDNKDKDKDQEKQDQDSQDQKKKNQEKQDQKDQEKQDQKDQEKQDQKDQDQNQEEQDQPKQDQNPQEQDQKTSSEEESEQEQDSEEQKDQLEEGEEQENEKESSSGSSEMREATQKEISKEELDRLLRSLENIEKVYGVPPKVPRHMKKPQKDW